MTELRKVFPEKIEIVEKVGRIEIKGNWSMQLKAFLDKLGF